MKSQGGCLCGVSNSDGLVSVGSFLALFGLFDYRARPEFCAREPWGSLSLSLFCFLLPHPRGCRTTDNTRTKHSRCSTVRQSTKPFDCVSTLTDAVAPTRCMIRTGHVNTSNHTGRYQYVWKIMENGHKGIKYSLHFPYILVHDKNSKRCFALTSDLAAAINSSSAAAR